MKGAQLMEGADDGRGAAGAGQGRGAVQDTMLSAWQNLGSFEQRASLRTWLYRIATRSPGSSPTPTSC